MEFVAVFALSAIVAMFYLWAQPKVFSVSSLQSLQKNYFGKVFLTASVIFGAILIAGLIFSLLGKEVTA